MFPIRDHNPSQQTPWVTRGLVVVNVLLFLATLPMVQGGEWLWTRLALYPLAIMQGELLWGLVTHMFLHGGIMHIAGNLLFLWILGDTREEQLGHGGFLAFYLAAGLGAAAAQIAAEPFSTIPMVGASGAIAGVMGGYLLLFPRARVDILAIFIVFFKIFTLPAWAVLGIWFAIQILGGFSMPGDEGGVAYWAHAGGFLAGMTLALPKFLRLGGSDFWVRTHGHPPHPEAVYAPTRMPRIGR